MKTLVIINFVESGYADSISDLAANDDVILITNPKSINDLKRQLEQYRGQFDEVFINAHGSMGELSPTIAVADRSVTIPELVEMINHHNSDSVKEIHLASCYVGSHFEQLERVDISNKYYSGLAHSLRPGQNLFLHGDEHISTTKEGKSRLLSVVNHESGPITNSILASSEELRVISRKSNNLRGSSSFAIFEHVPYTEFVSENSGDPLKHLRSYFANSLRRANEFEDANGMTRDPAAEEKLAKMSNEDLKKYLNEAFELELIKSPDPMKVISDWGYLLKSGVIDVRHDKSDWTILMYSAYHGHVDAVKAILADEEVGKKFATKGEMALILAARNGQTEVIKVLLESDKLDLSHNSKGVAAALKIAKEKNLTQVSDLIEDKILDWRIAENPQKLLFELVDKGDVETLRCAIAKGINLDIADEHGQTSFIRAVKKGDQKITEILADSRADLNLADKNGDTALKAAVKNGDVEMVELLLKHEKIERNFGQEFSQKLLEQAVHDRHSNVVKALLIADKEFDVNSFISYDQDGTRYEKTALEIAVQNHDTLTAKFLLEDDRIEPQKYRGWYAVNGRYRGSPFPPLHVAAASNDIEMVKLFVAKANEGKVDVNVVGVGMNEGVTPLMSAAQSGYVEVVRELLTVKNLDPNMRLRDNSTALILAADNDRTSVVKLLIEDPRTDLDIERYGKTALGVAGINHRFGTSEKSLLEESEKCRLSKMQSHALRGDAKKKVVSPKDVGLFIPENSGAQNVFPPVDQRISISNNQNQIAELNRLGFAQLALLLVAAAVIVRHFAGRLIPGKSPKASGGRGLDETTKSKNRE